MSVMSTADALTGEAVVLLQDRPIVALTPWLAEALAECGRTGRSLQVVTPGAARLSMALRLSLAGSRSLWVVREEDGGYYEGPTGRPLRWDGSAFSPVPEARAYAAGFTERPAAPISPQLMLTYRARHRDVRSLGAAAEALFEVLTGRSPAGWGPTEPVARLWDRAAVASYALDGRTIALVGAGRRPVVATLTPANAGSDAMDEVTTVVAGYTPAEPPAVTELPKLAGALLAEHPVSSLFLQLNPGRTDLTIEPRWVGSPAPVGMAIAGAVEGPPDLPGRQISPVQSPITWFTLGDGRSQDGWQRHRDLLRHLTRPR